jgi:hypothetical protein
MFRKAVEDQQRSTLHGAKVRNRLAFILNQGIVLKCDLMGKTNGLSTAGYIGIYRYTSTM